MLILYACPVDSGQTNRKKVKTPTFHNAESNVHLWRTFKHLIVCNTKPVGDLIKLSIKIPMHI